VCRVLVLASYLIVAVVCHASVLYRLDWCMENVL